MKKNTKSQNRKYRTKKKGIPHPLKQEKTQNAKQPKNIILISGKSWNFQKRITHQLDLAQDGMEANEYIEDQMIL